MMRSSIDAKQAPLARSNYERAVADHLRAIGPRLEQLDKIIVKSTADPAEYSIMRTIRIILRSGLFDEEFYIARNPEVIKAGIDPLEHYVRHGEVEGTIPNPFFSPAYYRRFYMREVPVNQNALQHYIERGERLRCNANKLFNAGAYFNANPCLVDFVEHPLFHFLKVGYPAKLRIRCPQKEENPGRPMRIAAHLGVKDEVEIIERTIAHLRAIGVDLILACDMASTDGTAEVLERYRGDDFRVLQLGDRSFDDAYWYDRNLEFIREIDADWMIFLDADEYWIPASGNLKDCVWLAEADALSVPRYNIPCGREGPIMPAELIPGHYEELLLVAKGIPDFAKYMRDNPDTPWILGQIEPKVMMRPECIGKLNDGLHDVESKGVTPALWVEPEDLFVAHLPLTTRTRHDRKIDDYRAHLRSDPAETEYSLRGDGMWESPSWQWRRWIKLADEGGLDAEFERNRLDANAINALRGTGVIRSAAELIFCGSSSTAGICRPMIDKSNS